MIVVEDHMSRALDLPGEKLYLCREAPEGVL